MSLTAQDVQWVAHLARLQLTDAELERELENKCGRKQPQQPQARSLDQ